MLLGLLLLAAGGEALLRGAVGLATQLRLAPAVIGLYSGRRRTSRFPNSPSVPSRRHRGSADIAVANVVGSNIFNISVIVGLCAVLRPMPIAGNTIRPSPVLALVTLLCLALAQDGQDQPHRRRALHRSDGLHGDLVSLVREQLTPPETRGFQSEVKERQAHAITARCVSGGLGGLGRSRLWLGRMRG
jgi:cation:H+ antiporter